MPLGFAEGLLCGIPLGIIATLLFFWFLGKAYEQGKRDQHEPQI